MPSTSRNIRSHRADSQRTFLRFLGARARDRLGCVVFGLLLAACGNGRSKDAPSPEPSGSVAGSSPVHRTDAGSGVGSSAARAATPTAFCFTPRDGEDFDQLVATDTAVTLCRRKEAEPAVCANLSLADGSFTAAAPLAAPKPVEPVLTSADGTRALALVEGKPAFTIKDVKTGKQIALDKFGGGQFKCATGAWFLGDTVYATADRCSLAPGHAWLFTRDGKPIGKEVDMVNLQDAQPYHLDGTTWLVRGSDHETVVVIDAASGKTTSFDIPGTDPATCCPLGLSGNGRPPFARAPNGRVFEVGASIAELDIAHRKTLKVWQLPLCASQP